MSPRLPPLHRPQAPAGRTAPEAALQASCLRVRTRPDIDATDVPEARGAALESHMRRHQPAVTIAREREALLHVPGVLDADPFAIIEKLFTAGRLMVESDEALVNEEYVARSRSLTRITAMAFEAAARTLTLTLRLPDGETALELVEPRDIRVGPQVFFIGGAKQILLDRETMEADGRTAFQLALRVFSEQGWEAVEAPRRRWDRALQAKLNGEKAKAPHR